VALLRKTRREIQTGQTKVEHWYVLTSCTRQRLNPSEFLKTIRAHWQIENSLHNVKDRALQEDHQAISTPGLGPVLTLRNLALNALRKMHPPNTTQDSIPTLSLNLLMKPVQTVQKFLTL
jgi:predicted transposase YbfD/YdcC